jgi:ubiquinone/menaquinone biosynthesis C-methylase UbiE
MNDKHVYQGNEEFENWYTQQQRPRIFKEIWSSVYGDDYPADADPLSFVTITDLNRIAALLEVSPGNIIADIGCGRGGPGLWVVKSTGTNLIGIDIASSAVRYAARRVSGTPLESRVKFQQGEFAATGLPDHSMDGVMSVDALLFAPARFAACQEMRRILKPGRLFVFTTWEIRKPSVSLRLDPILDYRSLLELSGFHVELYEETPDWERRMREVFKAILDRMDELIEQFGEEEASGFKRWATTRPPELSDGRRVLVAARAT